MQRRKTKVKIKHDFDFNDEIYCYIVETVQIHMNEENAEEEGYEPRYMRSYKLHELDHKDEKLFYNEVVMAEFLSLECESMIKTSGTVNLTEQLDNELFDSVECEYVKIGGGNGPYSENLCFCIVRGDELEGIVNKSKGNYEK